MSVRTILLLAATALGAAACATQTGESLTVEAQTMTDPRIGAEVDRICFPQNINSWRTIDGDDHGIVLREGVRDFYRVEFSGGCRASDFRFAEKIGIVSRPAGGCLTRSDRLLVEGPGDFVNHCLITKINEWNEDASEEDTEEMDG